MKGAVLALPISGPVFLVFLIWLVGHSESPWTPGMEPAFTLFVSVGSLAGMVLLGAGTFLVVGRVEQKQKEKRRRAPAAVAARMGWDFHEGESGFPLHRFVLFRGLGSPMSYNTLAGSFCVNGRQLGAAAGDFVISKSGRLSYAVAQLPVRSSPALCIRREALLDRLASFFGFPDINFESAEFSRRFRVSGPDPRFAPAVIHPRMIEFLLETDPGYVEIQGGYCWRVQRLRTCAPGDFPRRIRALRRFPELWPDRLPEAA